MSNDSEPNDIRPAHLLTTHPEFVSPSEPILIQAHWQNTENIHQTEFIAQSSFDEVEKAMEWARDMFERHLDSRPGERWAPLLCTQDSEYFCLAAKEAETKAT